MGCEGQEWEVEQLIGDYLKDDLEKSMRKCLVRCKALFLIRCQLLYLGVDNWSGELTDIERWEIDKANKAQETALHLAVVRSSISSVQALLAARASTEIRNSSGQTALHLAAKHCNELVVQALLDNRANPDAIDNTGKSCLEMACAHNPSCAAAFKRIGVDGWTPLMVASEKGGVEEYLLCRKYLLSVQNREPFPVNFRQEVQFYSGLLRSKSSKFEWGQKWIKESGDYVLKSEDAAATASLYSCALGKEEFVIGIHTWKIRMAEFDGQKAWITVDWSCTKFERCDMRPGGL